MSTKNSPSTSEAKPLDGIPDEPTWGSLLRLAAQSFARDHECHEDGPWSSAGLVSAREFLDAAETLIALAWDGRL